MLPRKKHHREYRTFHVSNGSNENSAEDAELTSAVANACKKRRGKEYKTAYWVAVAVGRMP
jgi:hypothetical protein